MIAVLAHLEKKKNQKALGVDDGPLENHKDDDDEKASSGSLPLDSPPRSTSTTDEVDVTETEKKALDVKTVEV